MALDLFFYRILVLFLFFILLQLDNLFLLALELDRLWLRADGYRIESSRPDTLILSRSSSWVTRLLSYLDFFRLLLVLCRILALFFGFLAIFGWQLASENFLFAAWGWVGICCCLRIREWLVLRLARETTFELVLVLF